MFEKITYKNHINEVIQFGSDGIYVNESDLHDFSWSVTKKNDRISAFTTGVVKKSIPVVIICESEDDGIAKRNRLFEICEKDVLAMRHGIITIGDYYLKCFITASKKKEYMKNRNVMKLTLTLQTDFPKWVKETTTIFNYGQGSLGSNFDYNSDFPYDYTSNLLGQQLNNMGFVEANFRMTIYGAIENPMVTINGHEYSVNVNIAVNEYLTIDSVAKTIILTRSDGTEENCFNLRNKESYIFEKIPTGMNTASNNGNFKFDITLLEERGEPKWT